VTRLRDGRIMQLGDAEWQVISTPGHTPGHLCLWQPDERLLIAGDAAAKHTPVPPGSLDVPFPRAWPASAPRRA